jgi:hypothetical protein
MPYPKRAADPTKPMSIRFTETERAEITHEAGVAGLSCGEYIRCRTLGHPVRAHISSVNTGGLSSAQTALVSQLNSLGGLLKNLHNQGLGHEDVTAKILIGINTVVQKLGDSAGVSQ